MSLFGNSLGILCMVHLILFYLFWGGAIVGLTPAFGGYYNPPSPPPRTATATRPEIG